jgi:SRSO17 transposase
MEKMAERVKGSRYQTLHHMLSESAWDRSSVRYQLIKDANKHFGYGAALVFDESAFAKKGAMSAGVARQWNGRLGKTENSQVGVFAAVARDGVAAVVDSELFVPEHWFDDRVRCDDAGIPEEQEFCTKGEIAVAMLNRLRREGLHFAYSVFDGGYGHLPWLLTKLDKAQETFMAEVHSDQTIYLTDPAPAVPEARSPRGKRPSRLKAQTAPLTVTAWANAQPASAWRRFSPREGEKGLVIADYLARRVWVWDEKERQARC